MRDKRLKAVVFYETPGGRRMAKMATPARKVWIVIPKTEAAQLVTDGKALVWDSAEEAIENHFLPFGKSASEKSSCCHEWFNIKYMPKFEAQWKRAWHYKCVNCGAFAR
jgi:hypothetical protein